MPSSNPELSCERECSRGEDYRLIKLSIIDYASRKEKVIVVECRGHDCARFQNVDHAHGWENDIVDMIEQKHGKQKISVSFECETLKADNAAEEHLKSYMPNLVGLCAVGSYAESLQSEQPKSLSPSFLTRFNVGQMSISGLDFKGDKESSECDDE
ncbi:hypothetical protein C4D60_Mb04t35080 [Musa balbisiana]|uniref:Uncharacterized protein n=1 Tax=Musa balbisiana TaxID=52838 RepID=A0A4S8KH27_MUSBA|nr:hypothetical protein C4D60_Mb04t35080 [Musa balbisiana]